MLGLKVKTRLHESASWLPLVSKPCDLKVIWGLFQGGGGLLQKLLDLMVLLVTSHFAMFFGDFLTFILKVPFVSLGFTVFVEVLFVDTSTGNKLTSWRRLRVFRATTAQKSTQPPPAPGG